MSFLLNWLLWRRAAKKQEEKNTKIWPSAIPKCGKHSAPWALRPKTLSPATVGNLPLLGSPLRFLLGVQFGLDLAMRNLEYPLRHTLKVFVFR